MAASKVAVVVGAGAGRAATALQSVCNRLGSRASICPLHHIMRQESDGQGISLYNKEHIYALKSFDRTTPQKASWGKAARSVHSRMALPFPKRILS